MEGIDEVALDRGRSCGDYFAEFVEWVALINRSREGTLSQRESSPLGHRSVLLSLKPKEPTADAPSLFVGSFSRR